MSEPVDLTEVRPPFSVVIAPPSTPRAAIIAVSASLVVLAAIFIAGLGTGYAFAPAREFEVPAAKDIPAEPAALKKLQTNLERENKQLAAALGKTAPKGNYIVIDQTQNRIYLMNAGQIVHQAVCSAGSGIVLKDFSGQRKWVFDTPRGVFKVRNRVEDPAWRKPDWAFVEEGKSVPKNPSDRIEYGTLGEYALYLEDGYMIHGTLYERLLGRSVSHGCVRVGRDDLRVLWKNAPLGTPVYIF